jgi:N-acetylmuramoyl-L-alanine amidase
MSSLRIVYGAVYHHFARQKTIILALAMVFLLRPQQSVAAPDTLHRVESLVLSEKETQVRVFLGQCVAPKILVLSNPHRVVLDFIGITQAPKLQSIATGNVQRVRFAPFNVGTGRLVLHTDQDSRVDSTQLLPQANGQCIWQATLYAKSAVVNAPQSNLPAQNIPAPVKEALTVPPIVLPVAPPVPAVAPDIAEPQISTCTIVLDAGHGGTDPGAMFAHLREKHITLYAAKELKRLINVLQPNAQVVLTRDKDVYIPLGERPAVAQKQRAHMFISLHADMLPHDVTIRGASVYTLSETASDPIAERLALAENKADNLSLIHI